MSGRTGSTWTVEQAKEALEKANLVKHQRMLWKQAQKERTKDAGLDALIELVANPPAWAYTWRLTEVLRACPNVGAVTVRYAINGFGIGFNHQTRIGWLTERQRDVVIQWAEGVKASYLRGVAKPSRR